jgi:hypothetical protein
MLKLLAILALATAGMVMAQTPTNPNGSTPATASGAEASSPKEQGATSTEQENLGIQRKRAWFTGGLVAVGLIQAFVMGWQVTLARGTLEEIHTQAERMKQQIDEMKTQTDVAKTSAEAASLNAQAAVNAERPWLLENIERDKDSDQEWIVSIRNAGNTPAEVVNGYWSYSLLSGDFKLPADCHRSIFPLQTTVIAKTDSFEAGRIDMRRYHDQALGGFHNPDGGGEFKHLYFHGNVEYWDTFIDRSSPMAKPHVTQWCYVYNPHAKEFNRAPCTYHDHS